jgi:hypothetical protein
MSGLNWQDFEKPNYDIIRGGLSGQSGYMPPELHLKKNERTCIYERKDQLNEHFRSTLRDTTPDAPTLAQELPRETQDQVRTEIINLRTVGARTAAEPIHPDLFLGFTERDARGYHNAGPDFRKYADQSRARVKFKDIVSDHASDWTIPEGRRSELRAAMDLRRTINASRERLKIFDTARDSRPIRYNGMKTNKSGVVKTTRGGTILNLNDAQEAYQRKDNTSLRGDVIKIGYRQSGDHRFAVAQYGLTSAARKHANIHTAQQLVHEDRKFDVSPSEIKTRLMINMMKEVDRRKHLNRDRNEMKGYFQNSMDTNNVIKKLAADLHNAQRNTEQTADVIDLGHINSNISKVRVYDPVAHDTVIVDRELFNTINEHKNISFIKKTDYTARNAIADEGKKHLPGDNMEVYVYSRKQPGIIAPLPVKMEQDWKDTNFAPLYKRGAMFASGVDATYTEESRGLDNPSADRVFDRYTKGSGYTQSVRYATDDTSQGNPVDDTDKFIVRGAKGRPTSRRR